MRIGVLSLQGDFAAHARVLQSLGVSCQEVRRPEQLEDTVGLIIPGGESTTMVKFIQEERFAPAFKGYVDMGRPIFGTCAGAILLASEIVDSNQFRLGFIDLSIRRNAYGRQVDSFIESAPCSLFDSPVEMVFIRAPIIERVGRQVQVLATVRYRPVLVRSANILAGTFHPELTSDLRVHQYFLNMVSADRPH